MEPDNYLRELAKAYRDELVGHVIATCVASRFGETWPHRDMMNRFADLELVTATVLKPLMRKYDLPMPEQEDILQEGRSIAENTESWDAMAAFFKSALPAIIETFEEMHAACPEEDRARIDLLLRHEKALLDVALEQCSERSIFKIDAIIHEMQALH